MTDFRQKLLTLFSLFFITLFTGCEDASDNGMVAEAPQPAGQSTTAKLVVGSEETPRTQGTGDTRFRATWDGRTIILDIRDEAGVLPATVAVTAKVKIRIPKDERDRFEDESDDDNSLPPGTFLATFDAESQVYVAQLPTDFTIPVNRKIKVKVTAPDYKTANGKVLLATDGPTYVGVLLRPKRNHGGGKSSLTVETISSLSVNPSTAEVAIDESLQLSLSGTLASGSTVIDPPTDISISPAGAILTVDLASGAYLFTAASAGVYTVTFSEGSAIAVTTITVLSPEPPTPITGYRTGSPEAWANNVASFLSHINATDNGFYDGGWNVAFATVESTDTQGGIGQPGFGQGVVIGSVNGFYNNNFYLYLTDGLWATTYLRGPGGPPGALTATQGNGVTSTSSGDFGHQVLALKFNVDFSNPPYGSTVSPGHYLPAGFGTLRLKATGGIFDGWSISDILGFANHVLAGGALPDGYTFQDLNTLLFNLNTSFETGTGSPWANAHLEVPVVPTLVSFDVGPTGLWTELAPGDSFNAFATGSYSDGGIVDLTYSVEWVSSDPGVASVGASGDIMGNAPGEAVITATLGDFSGSVTVKVIGAPGPALVNIEVSAPESVPVGSGFAFVATGVYEDGSTRDLTSAVSWSSVEPTVASIASDGTGWAQSEGTAVIYVQYEEIGWSFGGTWTFPVTAAEVVELRFASQDVTSMEESGGTSLQLFARFTDGTFPDITSEATWSSSDPSLATVDNGNIYTLPGSGGQSVTITATYGGLSTSHTIDIQAWPGPSLWLSWSQIEVPLGQTADWRVWHEVSHGSSIHVTNDVVWSSSNPSVAVVSNYPDPSPGQATALSSGETTITATYGDLQVSGLMIVP